MRSTSSPLAVTITTGMADVCGACLSRRHTSVPGMSGSIRSSSTRSKRSSRTARSAVSPSGADTTSNPACLKL